MARMVELIREGSAPRSLARRAARGELALPAGEAIEILVALAGDRELGEQAEQTLAGWDEPSLSAIAANRETPEAVLRHLLQSDLRRPAVIEALCGNPAVALEELDTLVLQGGAETLQAMVRSERVRNSSRLLELMAGNPESEAMGPQLAEWRTAAQAGEGEEVVAGILAEHSGELAGEDHRPFELVPGVEGEDDPLARLLQCATQGEQLAEPEEQEQLSVLQRIGRLRVGERIKLAVRGSREERMILIRDRSKLVALAVIASPKVSDAEMESYAAMKNIQESVLRAIASNRKNMKNYGVIRTLSNNPKSPLDVALPLLPYLLINDLRSLSRNKNVNETVRKVALKLFRTKTERKTE